uniref:Uncharacterized protein n=1 Tax=Triticum urartu TaxID=4572 RepID=A0A8R7PEU3_TRIUA
AVFSPWSHVRRGRSGSRRCRSYSLSCSGPSRDNESTCPASPVTPRAASAHARGHGHARQDHRHHAASSTSPSWWVEAGPMSPHPSPDPPPPTPPQATPRAAGPRTSESPDSEEIPRPETTRRSPCGRNDEVTDLRLAAMAN